jgi:hypothetical protein
MAASLRCRLFSRRRESINHVVHTCHNLCNVYLLLILSSLRLDFRTSSQEWGGEYKSGQLLVSGWTTLQDNTRTESLRENKMYAVPVYPNLLVPIL